MGYTGFELTFRGATHVYVGNAVVELVIKHHLAPMYSNIFKGHPRHRPCRSAVKSCSPACHTTLVRVGCANQRLRQRAPPFAGTTVFLATLQHYRSLPPPFSCNPAHRRTQATCGVVVGPDTVPNYDPRTDNHGCFVLYPS